MEQKLAILIRGVPKKRCGEWHTLSFTEALGYDNYLVTSLLARKADVLIITC